MRGPDSQCKHKIPRSPYQPHLSNQLTLGMSYYYRVPNLQVIGKRKRASRSRLDKGPFCLLHIAQTTELWPMENKELAHLLNLNNDSWISLLIGKRPTEENHQDPSHTMNSHITHLYLQNNVQNVPSTMLSTRLQGWLRQSPTWVGHI